MTVTWLVTEVQLPAASYAGHMPAAENWNARLSLCCHPSVKRTALSSSPDSGTTRSDTHSVRNAAWLPPPPPPIAATREISPTCPSHLRPFTATDKVAYSSQSAACSPLLTPSPRSTLQLRNRMNHFPWIAHLHKRCNNISCLVLKCARC